MTYMCYETLLLENYTHSYITLCRNMYLCSTMFTKYICKSILSFHVLSMYVVIDSQQKGNRGNSSFETDE